MTKQAHADQSVRSLVSHLSTNTGQEKWGRAYTVWVNRPLARYAAAAAYKLGLSANQVTLLSGFLAFLAIGLLIVFIPTPASALFVALLLAFAYVLDSADGMLARLSNSGSVFGEWLDHSIDALKVSVFHSGILLGMWLHFDVPTWSYLLPIVFGIVNGFQYYGSTLASKLAPGNHTMSRLQLLTLPLDTGVLYLSVALWAWPQTFLTVYGALMLCFLAFTGLWTVRTLQRLGGKT